MTLNTDALRDIPSSDKFHTKMVAWEECNSNNYFTDTKFFNETPARILVRPSAFGFFPGSNTAIIEARCMVVPWHMSRTLLKRFANGLDLVVTDSFRSWVSVTWLSVLMTNRISGVKPTTNPMPRQTSWMRIDGIRASDNATTSASGAHSAVRDCTLDPVERIAELA